MSTANNNNNNKKSSYSSFIIYYFCTQFKTTVRDIVRDLFAIGLNKRVSFLLSKTRGRKYLREREKKKRREYHYV
jgi:hypothetical protein